VFATLIIIPVAVLLATGGFMVLVCRWLAQSWEVVSDDELHDRDGIDAFWLCVAGWLSPGVRRLTYRRDRRGRFRRHRR
jgi:hypothetical protein